jgi:dihydrofolate reductase
LGRTETGTGCCRPQGESVEFYSGDLNRLTGEILAPQYGNIWLVGGAMLGQSFLRLGLVDEIRLMIAPVLLATGCLGDGLRLFSDYRTRASQPNDGQCGGAAGRHRFNN